jgi:CheY-like chemotaxis protein/AraC-like DNA-binding protein
MLTSEEFLKHLRDALNHLYDPDRLRTSPLAALLGVGDRFDTPSALQHLLTHAIESLEPSSDEPSRSHSRQVCDLLLYRYVQQFSQQEVADQLGMSVRHLRREQRAALEALAYHLWEQFDLEEKLHEGIDGKQAEKTVDGGRAVSDELAWLKDAPPDRLTDLTHTLPAVLELAQSMAVQHDAQLETHMADDIPNLAVHPIALRQILLNLLTVAIHRASGERVIISAKPRDWQVDVQVHAQPRRQDKSSATSPRGDEAVASSEGDEGDSLDMARRLADLCRCGLSLSTESEAFIAVLTLPALERLPVLVIDDNADTIQLMQRYTTGTRYSLFGTQDLEQALSMAEKLSPQIIMLDVMMPEVDGWEVLGRLRQHPLTCHIPIIVCTILAQEELALSLGASGFLRKPITRQALLGALGRQVDLMGRGHC